MATIRERDTTVQKRPGWYRDAIWLAPAIVAAPLVYAAYLATHPLPAYGAGLFLVTAEQVSQHGYRLPETIPYYTARGIPFAYPPLVYYVLAVLRDAAGIPGLALARYLPGLAVALSLVPTYFVARDLLESRPRAGFATLLVAVSPPILQWHVSAGGLVRAPAFLFLMAGLYTGVRLFKYREPRWRLPSLALFALTLLTHPVYTVTFAISFLWLYAYFDRTSAGLLDGAFVGIGGVALASPWWGLVVARHGVDAFVGAAGTHGGIGGRLATLAAVVTGTPTIGFSSVLFTADLTALAALPNGLVIMTAWLFVILLLTGYVFVRHDAFLPGWFVVVGVLVWKARFAFLIGALITAVAVFESLIPFLARRWPRPNVPIGPAVACVICVAAMGVGVAYATGDLDARTGSQTLPQYVDAADVEAMEWAHRNTHPEAAFVVIGDGAEWFPYVAGRTSLVGHWGVEWQGKAAFDRQYRLRDRLSDCSSESCVTLVIDELRPASVADYLYVPTRTFTDGGIQRHQDPELVTALVRSDRYQLVFRNDGVALFRIVDANVIDDGPDRRLGSHPDALAGLAADGRGTTVPHRTEFPPNP